ncbi:MAG: hypothetical protein KGI37_06505 [Alphaproteobacteria bacterium]|nr:hypothetical protein [Alphaproteobacteria bacterium]
MLEPADNTKAESEECNRQANAFLGAGLGLSAYMATTAATLSFVCPVCAVTTPVLLGMGVYKKIKAKRLRDNQIALPQEP